MLEAKTHRFPEAASYYLRIIELSQQVNILEKEPGILEIEAQAFIEVGRNQYTTAEYPLSSVWFFKALNIAKILKDRDLEAKAYVELGNSRYTDDSHTRYEDWFLKALDTLDKGDRSPLAAQAYLGLGIAGYKSRPGYPQGTYWYLKALDILNLVQNRHQVYFKAQTYIGLGNVKYCDKSHSKSAYWYLDTLNLITNRRYPQLEAQAYIGLGTSSLTNHECPTPAHWYYKALNCLKGNRNSDNIKAQAHLRLADYFYSERDDRKALKHYREVLPLHTLETRKKEATRMIKRIEGYLYSSRKS
ncbi:hypothetical protein [Candidatus Odyssella thessalonicensis]|uniref:hypothetical protein n=1 Tax=Candidatus Odyssella thessalonicensis TaxID=84647 RepID=UPI000225A8CA|nr:hypothetical protein [Candidatus Odyssella thessalonicensis]